MKKTNIAKLMKTNWEISAEDSEAILKYEVNKFTNYLKMKGRRNSTILGYVSNIKRFLRFVGNSKATPQDVDRFYDFIISSNVSRSTFNQYSYSIRAYFDMNGEKINFKRMAVNNQIPYYFSKEEVVKIFSVIRNQKHLALLKTMFYGCLRSSELANLLDEDVNFKDLTIRVREGKGGKDGIVFITSECAATLKKYLMVRPKYLIDGKQYLFFTDFGNKYSREDIYRLFINYKRLAGIEKRGGAHTWSRHSPGTLMVKNGCDIRIVQQVLRHSDIRTSLRYCFIEDTTRRERYEKSLVL